MRRSLVWSLAATGIASLAAIWLSPQEGTPTVEAAPHPAPSSNSTPTDPYANWKDATSATNATVPSASPQTHAPLPKELPERDIEAGGRDIFTPVQPPAPPAPPPPPPPSPPPPPPPPQAPPMNWRALGSMVTPAGERLIWLSKGNDELTVKLGTRLDDGFVVQGMDQDAVTLLYPALGTTYRVALPRAQAPSP